MRLPIALSVLTAALTAALPAHAELAPISDRAQFVELVAGKTLTRPLVSLTVDPGGAISGNGAGWDVNGEWRWEDGYFCRNLTWGGDPLGYNCQAVASDGTEIRFTSDRGAGRSAAFTLR